MVRAQNTHVPNSRISAFCSHSARRVSLRNERKSTRRVFCSSQDKKNKQLNKFKKPRRFLRDENKKKCGIRKIRNKPKTKPAGCSNQLSRSSCSWGVFFSFSLISDDLSRHTSNMATANTCAYVQNSTNEKIIKGDILQLEMRMQ